MSLALSLVATVLLVLLSHAALQKAPAAFYALGIVLVASGIYLIMNPSPSPVLRACASVLQKGHVAFSLFAVVMYLGVLPKSSRLWRRPIAVRAELSILASILICAHSIPYLLNYFAMLPIFWSLKESVIFSLVLSLFILVLLVPLTATSFKAVRGRMNPGTWKRLQRFAYLFYALIYFHLIGYLLVPLQQGSLEAAVNVAIYTALFGAYAALRLKKASAERAVP
jgi:DMSO/TMAO reductase YedYZ heme-binding membrane subunit